MATTREAWIGVDADGAVTVFFVSAPETCLKPDGSLAFYDKEGPERTLVVREKTEAPESYQIEDVVVEPENFIKVKVIPYGDDTHV